MNKSTVDLMLRAANRVIANHRAGRKMAPDSLRWAAWVIAHGGNPPGLAEALEANRRKASPP